MSTANAENPTNTETSATAQRQCAPKRQELLFSIVFSFQSFARHDTAGSSVLGNALSKIEVIVPQVLQNVVREITFAILRTFA
jgi:hypothetical protein